MRSSHNTPLSDSPGIRITRAMKSTTVRKTSNSSNKGVPKSKKNPAKNPANSITHNSTVQQRSTTSSTSALVKDPVIPQSSSNIDSVSAGSSENSLYTPTLHAIPKPMCIFVSRLAPHYTADDISKYIASKCNITMDNGFKCTKLNVSKSDRFISSFKIFADKSLADQMLSQSFWPTDAIVHEYENRKNFLGKNSRRQIRTIN